MNISKISAPIDLFTLSVMTRVIELNKLSRRREVLDLKERMGRCRLLATVFGKKSEQFDYYQEMGMIKSILKVLKLKHRKSDYSLIGYFKPKLFN